MSSIYTSVSKITPYDVCFVRYSMQQTYFFVIFGHFLPLYPTIDPENKNLGKM